MCQPAGALTTIWPQSIFPPRSLVAAILTRNDSHQRLDLCRRCLRGIEFLSRTQRLVSRSSSTGARAKREPLTSTATSPGTSFRLRHPDVGPVQGRNPLGLRFLRRFPVGPHLRSPTPALASPRRIKSKVFEEFRQAGTVKKVEGTGLGLTLCRKFVGDPQWSDLGKEPGGRGLDVHVHDSGRSRLAGAPTGPEVSQHRPLRPGASRQPTVLLFDLLARVGKRITLFGMHGPSRHSLEPRAQRGLVRVHQEHRG